MNYLKQEIIDFTSTNLTESVAEWSAATTYAVGDLAKKGTYIYKSAIASNLNNDPEEYNDIKWLKYQISNKYAMLDLSANSKSEYTGSLTVTFTQNRMSTLAIGNYDATTISVEVLDELDATIWSYESEDTLNENVSDWWDYIYSDYGYEVNRGIKIELGRIGTSVRVTFNSSVDVPITACGYLVGGEKVDMGCTLYGVSFTYNSFATKEFDTFGTLNLIKRGVQDLVDFNTVIDNSQLQSSRRKIKSIYNDIIVFIVDEQEDSNHENLLTLGVIQDASTVLSNPTKTTISWSVVEVI